MNIIQILNNSSKKKSQFKKQPFVVVNTDETKIYIRSIISSMKKNGLLEADAQFGGKRAKNIKLNDVIVVGDCESIFDYDYRVVKQKNTNELLSLDGRTFKVYNALTDYHTILSKIKSYAKANRYENPYYTAAPKKRRRPVKRQQPCQQDVIQVNVSVKDQATCPYFKAKNVRKYKRVDPVETTEKVTFFDNWIKIGLHQFDIEHDLFGNTFIQDGGRNKYYISEDRYGRRFLVTR